MKKANTEQHTETYNIETLALVNEGAAIRRHIDNGLLRNLPDCLVEILDVLWDLGNLLHGTIVRNQLVLEFLRVCVCVCMRLYGCTYARSKKKKTINYPSTYRRPNAELDQVAQQMPRHTHKLSGEGAPHIEIGVVRLH